jgi:hypothetical protein
MARFSKENPPSLAHLILCIYLPCTSSFALLYSFSLIIVILKVDIRHRSRSLSTNRSRQTPQSLSYPTFVPHQGRPLGSVKSEGAATSKKDIGVKGFMENVTNLPSQSTDRRVHHENDSSDDEEDIIVRIDSPSTLSFRPS